MYQQRGGGVAAAATATSASKLPVASVLSVWGDMSERSFTPYVCLN